jgi:hypothetical protein
MKKSISILILGLIVTAGLFAQVRGNRPAKEPGLFSVGAGGFIGGDFGGGLEYSTSYQGQSSKMSATFPYFGGGGFVFLDAAYAELSLAVFSGGGKIKVESQSQTAETDMSYVSFDIGLLGKYPFALNERLTVFPLLGINYQIMLSVKGDGVEYKGLDGEGGPVDFSALWFKLGGGLDYSFTNKIYARFEALYGLRLANKYENDIKVASNVLSSAFGGSADVKTLFGHGPTVKLAVGYRF